MPNARSGQRGKSPLIVPVILSGGAGTRLWPLSTDDCPKQFVPLTGPNSLYQEALRRVDDTSRFTHPIVVGGARHAQLLKRGLVGRGELARLILEPCARNTAPAIIMAAAVARELYGNEAQVLVMPSDHVIEDVPAFHDAIRIGEPAARLGRLVTFGVLPTSADTGYGYIEKGAELSAAPGAMEVARFVEKPPLTAAQEMVASGNYLWNAGIFLFRVDVLLNEAQIHAPAIAETAQCAISAACCSGICIVPNGDVLAESPSEAIDTALMERSAIVAVVPMSIGWSDLGSWDALAALAGDSAAIGPVTAIDCTGTYIRSDGPQIAVLGVSDLIIVASGDRVLIVPRGRSQEVKSLLESAEAISRISPSHLSSR
jgi:mannose-1-phosphate guanylyltransferase